MCYDGGDESDPGTLKGAPLSGAGLDQQLTISELAQLCPSAPRERRERRQTVFDRCAPAFAADADQACPDGCRDALGDVAAVGASAATSAANAELYQDAKPGFTLTLT